MTGAVRMEIVLVLCGAFYAVLCVFSIVTGLLYAGGRRQLNPLELSDRFMSRFSDASALQRFTVRMGWVTVFVGVLQGITAFALFHRGSPALYWIALGFTVFSIGSVAVKLKGKLNIFPILKGAAYLAILAVLLLRTVRGMFYGSF